MKQLELELGRKVIFSKRSSNSSGDEFRQKKFIKENKEAIWTISFRIRAKKRQDNRHLFCKRVYRFSLMKSAYNIFSPVYYLLRIVVKW